MKIFPAIDLFDNKAVRLFKGDYAQMTVYNENPIEVAKDFQRQGAEQIHVVDLAGAKLGVPMHAELIGAIVKETGLFVEVGGGIRDMSTVDKYLSAGASRVILGTVAVTNPQFVKEAVDKYGDKIAVGADIADGKVAIKGWVEKSEFGVEEFLVNMQKLGVKTIICTDVSKDGAMKGANHALYQTLQGKFDMQIIASGGVSSMDDITTLTKIGVHGAIVGKAYYIGAIQLREAIEVAK